MILHKRVRARGKLSLGKLFKIYNPGDRVSLVYIPGEKIEFPRNFHGRTGLISEKRGNAYVINVKVGGTSKQFIVKGIHLKKLSS